MRISIFILLCFLNGCSKEKEHRKTYEQTDSTAKNQSNLKYNSILDQMKYGQIINRVNDSCLQLFDDYLKKKFPLDYKNIQKKGTHWSLVLNNTPESYKTLYIYNVDKNLMLVSGEGIHMLFDRKNDICLVFRYFFNKIGYDYINAIFVLDKSFLPSHCINRTPDKHHILTVEEYIYDDGDTYDFKGYKLNYMDSILTYDKVIKVVDDIKKKKFKRLEKVYFHNAAGFKKTPIWSEYIGSYEFIDGPPRKGNTIGFSNRKKDGSAVK